MAIATIFAMVGCSKSDDERGNYVKLDNVRYEITSAFYFVDNGNLTIQFETAEPDVFLYFKGKSTIPSGETSISYESLDDNCIVTCCFETEEYISTDGSMTLSSNTDNHTIKGEGHFQSLSNNSKSMKINYIGELVDATAIGTSGNAGSFSGSSISHDDFKLGPVFSYIESAGGDGRIKVYCDNNSTTWTVESNVDWCCILTNDNGTGDGAFRFSVEKNLSNTDRSAKITVKSGDGTTRRAYVFQKPGAYDLVVKPDKLEFGTFGGTKTIHVYAITGLQQHSWTATCDASWIHLSTTSGIGNTDIRVTVDRNTSSERTATIMFKTESKTIRYTTLFQNEGGEASGSFLIYDGDEIEMESVCLIRTVQFNLFGETITQTLLHLGYEGGDENGHIIERVHMTVQDFPNSIPVGNFTCGTTYNLSISVVDLSGNRHSATSGNVSITRSGTHYEIHGNGVADGKPFTIEFIGSITTAL